MQVAGLIFASILIRELSRNLKMQIIFCLFVIGDHSVFYLIVHPNKDTGNAVCFYFSDLGDDTKFDLGA